MAASFLWIAAAGIAPEAKAADKPNITSAIVADLVLRVEVHKEWSYQ